MRPSRLPGCVLEVCYCNRRNRCVKGYNFFQIGKIAGEFPWNADNKGLALSARLVEKILPPLFIAMPDQAHQLPRGMQREGARPALQLQSGFFRCAVPFAVVARVAGRDQVFPRRAAASRARKHVIQGQLGSGKRNAAKLARVSVAQKDILARERAALLGNMPVADQANH